MKIETSKSLFDQALSVIPGGVNSPVRACRSVDSVPLFIKEAEGCFITDADGNRYIDYVGSWGPMILGHGESRIIQAIQNVLKRGTSFGAPTDIEVTLAEMIVDAVPSIDMVRLVNSGTEATMSAVRLARGYTERDLIVKFDGCYHGHADALLVEAGSGVATLAIPGSPGIPKAFAEKTVSLPYNDIEAFRDFMDKRGGDVAGVIVEPVAGNMGMVPPIDGFLETLREMTKAHDALLIFDEVITGFRVAYGGAQELFGIDPDLTCLGKIIGGGLPVGAFGGKREIMEKMAPVGPVYQAGTLSGNPVAVSAGIAMLEGLKNPEIYRQLEETAVRLTDGLKNAAKKAKIPVRVNHVGSMIGMFFNERTVQNYADAKTCDLDRFTKWFSGLRENGIYVAPSQFESMFVSTAHGDKEIDSTIEAAGRVFKAI